MNFITASQIHNGQNWLPESTVLEISENGIIQAIHASGIIPEEKIQVFEGVICPGFVNTHCHLELSHFKDKVEEGTGLIPFLQTITKFRNSFSEEEKQVALENAINETKSNGIVAVGDIVNGLDTLKARLSAGLHIHTFVEALGFIPNSAIDRFDYAEKIYQQFLESAKYKNNLELRQSIVPHAPYSNSGKLISLIDEFDSRSILSIHNQETEAENQFFQNKTGSFLDFYQSFPMDISFLSPSGKTSLQTYLPWISNTHPIILVHNTFMTKVDMQFLKAEDRNLFFCLCPNANWYIERRLPPIDLFDQSDCQICIGTDSLASNHGLNILSELQMIKKYFPNISWEKLLRWGTWNGAVALQLENKIGKIEVGKKPGLIHLSGNDFERLSIISA